jgi:RNA polymerase sigma factor (TIGR02999 family)
VEGDTLEGRVTQLLRRASSGDRVASDELMPIIYSELHRLARRHLSHERPGHTLQATALVNEAYMRIFGRSNTDFPDRAHFLAFASRVMRSILVDHARARNAAKRGGDAQKVSDGALEVALDETSHFISVLDLHAAIDELAASHPQPAQAIEMRYFGGMTAEETSVAVGRTVFVVQHELRFAHAWLRRRLTVDPAS